MSATHSVCIVLDGKNILGRDGVYRNNTRYAQRGTGVDANAV